MFLPRSYMICFVLSTKDLISTNDIYSVILTSLSNILSLLSDSTDKLVSFILFARISRLAFLLKAGESTTIDWLKPLATIGIASA